MVSVLQAPVPEHAPQSRNREDLLRGKRIARFGTLCLGHGLGSRITWVQPRQPPPCTTVVHPKTFFRGGASTAGPSRLDFSSEAFLSPPDL
jgi:hypothetical protein